MSRELIATLISAAMLAAVFLVASRTDRVRDARTGLVRVLGVELARDSSHDDVSAVAASLNQSVKAKVMQDLGISEAELAAERDRVLDRVFLEQSEAERQIRQFTRAAGFLDEAVAQMPGHVVSDYDEQSQFISALNLPDVVDDSPFRNLLAAEPERRPTLAAMIEREANRPVEDLLAEMRVSFLPIAETQALRLLVCDRADAPEPGGTAIRGGDRNYFGVSTSCSFFAMQYAERLLAEDLPQEAALRARVLSVLSLAQVP